MICKEHRNKSNYILNVLNYWLQITFSTHCGVLEFIDTNLLMWCYWCYPLSNAVVSCWRLSEGSSFRGLWLPRKYSPQAQDAHWIPGLFVGALHTLYSKLSVFFILETEHLYIIIIFTRFLLNVMSICKSDLPATSCLWERIQFAEIMNYPAPAHKNQEVLIGQ